jgi:hypothetical protein
MKNLIDLGSHLHLSASQVRDGYILFRLNKGMEKTKSMVLTLVVKGGDKKLKTLNGRFLDTMRPSKKLRSERQIYP